MQILPFPDFKLLFELSPDLSLVLATDLTITAVTDAFLKATGLAKETVIGLKMSDVIPESSPHWITNPKPIADRDGNVTGFICQLLKRTKPADTETGLIADSKFYELLIETAEDYAIFLIDPDGRVASWNKGAERIKGYTAGEIVGQPISVLYTPEDRKLGLPEENLRKAFESGRFESEGLRCRRDGSQFWASLVITSIRDQQGVFHGYSKITRDITEKKKAADQVKLLSRLINQSNDAIYTVNDRYKVTSWNLGAEKLYGFTAAEAMGLNSNLLLRTLLEQHELDSMVEQIARDDYWRGELKRKTKKGKDLHVLSSTTTIRNLAGEITGYIAVSFDVTEQKKLREQVNHLAQIVEQSSEAIISCGTDSSLMSWNTGAEQLFGFTKEEAIGKTVWELGIVNLAQPEIDSVTDEILKFERWASETVFFHKNGKSFHGVVSINPVTGEDGSINSLVVVIQDISLRVAWEEQLKELNQTLEDKVTQRTIEIKRNEEKYHHLFDNNPLPLWVIDPKTLTFLAVNDMAVKNYGYSREEFLGMTALDIRPADDRARFKSLYRNIDDGDEEHKKGVWRHCKKDGSLIFVEVIAHNISFEGKPARIILSHDITEKKQTEDLIRASESRFRNTLDNMLEGIQIHDFDWKYVYVNQSLLNFTNSTREELIGTTLGQQYPGIEKTPLFSVLQRCMTDRVSDHLETEFTFPDGRKGDFQLSIRPVPEGIFILSINVTARKKAQDELRRSNERFELVVSATHDVIWDWDMHDDTLWRNKNYYTHFGYELETEPQAPGNWHARIHPGDKERVLSGINSVLKEKKHYWTDEYRYIKADNSVAYVLDSGYVIYNEDHQPQRMVGAMLDITGRKLAEKEIKKNLEEKRALAERVSVILNTLPANIALLDENGLIVEVNEGWRRFARENNFQAENYGIGERYAGIPGDDTGLDDEGNMNVANGIDGVLRGKRKDFIHEYCCHSPTEDRWFRMIATPLEETGSNGIVVMHLDISEVKRLEQERLQAKTDEQIKITQAMLQWQEKERTAIGIELHDNVNQILVGTNLVLSMIKKNPTKHGYLAAVCMENVQNAISENRKIAHELVAPDLNRVKFKVQLEELTAKMLGISGIKVVILSTEFEESKLDNQRLLSAYRIVQEQCTNIVKYADAENVTISLQTSGGAFQMAIADDGNGMEPGKISQGIGLRNIEGRLRVFNGEAIIETSPGGGFRLEVTMPL